MTASTTTVLVADNQIFPTQEIIDLADRNVNEMADI
jgi:hypothetical protein